MYSAVKGDDAVAAEYGQACKNLDDTTILLESPLFSDSEAAEARKSRLSNLSHASTYNPLHPENSKYLTAFLLVNNMIGSGILNQPYVFMKSGLLGGLFGFVMASYMTWACVNLLTDAGLHAHIYEYQGLAKHAFGRSGEIIIDAAILLLAFGALVGYILVVGGTMSDLLISWGCNGVGCEQDVVTIVCVLVFVTPICMFRHFGHLAILSVFSIATIVVVLFLVLIGGPLKQVHGEAVVLFKLPGIYYYYCIYQ